MSSEINENKKLSEYELLGCKMGKEKLSALQDLLAHSKPSQQGFGSPEQALSVLAIEDSPTNQQLLIALLKKLNVQIDVVESAEQGIAALQEKTYQLVLLDLELPGMNGLKACEIIRQENALKLPMIVAITANQALHSEAHIKQCGFDAILWKPYQTEQLRQVVQLAQSPFRRLED